ncbi:MAG TPA: VanZ family protein [Chitinophagaceae bacterium]|nr:VanZ family protein [Chitinophagaceae bacterium]
MEDQPCDKSSLVLKILHLISLWMFHQLFKPTVILLSVIILLWVLFRIIWFSCKENSFSNISYKKEIRSLLFVLYTGFVLSVTLLPVPVTRVKNPGAVGINVIPVINTAKHFFSTLSPENSFKRSDAIENIIGNILLFIPLGIFLFYSSFSLERVIIIAFSCSVCIELIQLISTEFGNYRTVDIDDILLNTFGALAGFIIIKKMRTKNVRHTSPDI